LAVHAGVVAIVWEMAGAAPTSTLMDLLGAPVAEVTAQEIKALVDGQVKETDELDFKATLYGRDDDAKVELCKDVAALRNQRGGAILLGVGDKDAVANGCPEVDLSDAEERRWHRAPCCVRDPRYPRRGGQPWLLPAVGRTEPVPPARCPRR